MLRRLLLGAAIVGAFLTPISHGEANWLVTRDVIRGKRVVGCSQQLNTVVLSVGQTSWTVPTGVTNLKRVVAWAAGGGASNGNNNDGAGGGASSEDDNVAVTPGNNVTVSIGVHGSGGASSTTSLPGTAGGDTSVTYSGSEILLAKGGQPSVPGGAGTGGQASGGIGTIKFSGGTGAGGAVSGNGAGGGGGAGGPSGDGLDGTTATANSGGPGGAGDASSGGAGGGTGGAAGGSGSELGPAGSGGGGAGGNSAQTGGAGGALGGGAGGTGFEASPFLAGASGGDGGVAIVYSLCSSAPPPPPPANSFFVANGGSDSNPGTVASPFATLGQCQTAMRNSTTKTCTLRGGTYSLSSTISLTGADNNETWQFYSADGVDTAVLSGGTTLDRLMTTNGTTGVTINGLKFSACGVRCFTSGETAVDHQLTFENNEITGNHGGSGGALQFCAVCFYNGVNALLSHNYTHGTTGPGLALSAWATGTTMAGGVIDSNVTIFGCQTLSDCGNIYTSARNTSVGGGAPTITNNYSLGQGFCGATNDENGIYLDDQTSNAVVKGNFVGAPSCLTTASRNNASGVLLNDDSFLNPAPPASNTLDNQITGNIFDLGSSAMLITASLGGQGTVFKGNIVISSFTGAQQTSASGITGFSYYDSSAVSLTLTANDYTNYAGGGSVFSNGHNQSDSAPQTYSVAQLGFSCPSGIPQPITAGSPVLSGPVSFQQLKGGWGPQGFTIPPQTLHSC